MSRIRSLKPELRELLAYASLTDCAARLFVMLYTLVDDEGRCPASAGYLAGAVFFARRVPATAIGRALAEIERAGLVRTYSISGAPFLEIVGWRDKGSPTHQRIEKPQPARFPAPTSFGSGNGSGTGSATDSGTDLDLDHDHDQERDVGPDQRHATSGHVQHTTLAASEDLDHERSRSHDLSAEHEAPKDHRGAIDEFDRRYRAAYDGAKPTWGAKQVAQLKKLVHAHRCPEVVRRIGILFEHPPAFLSPPFDVGTLVQHFDKLAVVPARREQRFKRDDDQPAIPASHLFVPARDGFGEPIRIERRDDSAPPLMPVMGERR